MILAAPGELEHELATGTQGKKRSVGTGMVRAGFMGEVGIVQDGVGQVKGRGGDMLQGVGSGLRESAEKTQ